MRVLNTSVVLAPLMLAVTLGIGQPSTTAESRDIDIVGLD
jgi:hypothetical protein